MSSGPTLPPVHSPSGIVHVAPDDTLWQIFRRADSDQLTILRTLPDHTALPDVQISQADYDDYRLRNPQLGLPELGDADSSEADAEADSVSSVTESRHIAHAGSWTATTIEPDWCEVEGEPIPFDSHAEINAPQRASPNVKARGTPVYAITHLHRGIQGDAGCGLVSGTSGESGHTQILTGQTDVKVNGLMVGRHDSLALINCDAKGCGGALGQLHTAIKPLSLIEQITRDANKTPEQLREDMDWHRQGQGQAAGSTGADWIAFGPSKSICSAFAHWNGDRPTFPAERDSRQTGLRGTLATHTALLQRRKNLRR